MGWIDLKVWQKGVIYLTFILSIISFSENISAQQPCENIEQHLENSGVFEPPFYIYKKHGGVHFVSRGNKTIAMGQVMLGVDSERSGYAEITGKSLFYIDCESGKVFDHSPSTSEIFGVPKPEKIDEGLFFQMVTKSPDTPIEIEIYTNVDSAPELEEQLRQIGVTVVGTSKSTIQVIMTPEQRDIIKNYDWVYDINYHGDDTELKRMGIILTTLLVTPEFEDQINQTGAEVLISHNFHIIAKPTASQIETIADLKWVEHMGIVSISTMGIKLGWWERWGKDYLPPIFLILILSGILIFKRIKHEKN